MAKRAKTPTRRGTKRARRRQPFIVDYVQAATVEEAAADAAYQRAAGEPVKDSGSRESLLVRARIAETAAKMEQEKREQLENALREFARVVAPYLAPHLDALGFDRMPF